MPVAHTPSTLGQGFNNTLAILSSLALPGRVTAWHCSRWKRRGRSVTPLYVRAGLNLLQSASDSLSSTSQGSSWLPYCHSACDGSRISWLMPPRRRNARDTEVRRQIDYLIAQTCSLIILLNYLIISSLLSFLAGNQPWLPFHPSTCRRVAYWLVDAYSIKMLWAVARR